MQNFSAIRPAVWRSFQENSWGVASTPPLRARVKCHPKLLAMASPILTDNSKIGGFWGFWRSWDRINCSFFSHGAVYRASLLFPIPVSAIGSVCSWTIFFGWGWRCFLQVITSQTFDQDTETTRHAAQIWKRCTLVEVILIFNIYFLAVNVFLDL